MLYVRRVLERNKSKGKFWVRRVNGWMIILEEVLWWLFKGGIVRALD